MIATRDNRDTPSDSGGSRWELSRFQFSGDWDLQETRRCPDHDYTGNDLSQGWIRGPGAHTMIRYIVPCGSMDQAPPIAFEPYYSEMRLWAWQRVEHAGLVHCRTIYPFEQGWNHLHLDRWYRHWVWYQERMRNRVTTKSTLRWTVTEADAFACRPLLRQALEYHKPQCVQCKWEGRTRYRQSEKESINVRLLARPLAILSSPCAQASDCQKRSEYLNRTQVTSIFMPFSIIIKFSQISFYSMDLRPEDRVVSELWYKTAETWNIVTPILRLLKLALYDPKKLELALKFVA